MVETIASCIVLVVIMLACLEIFSIESTRIDMEKVVREGAREASITGNIDAGERKAADVAQQYLSDKNPVITHSFTQIGGNDAVIFHISVDYKYLQMINSDGIGGGQIDAEATYPYNENYE